MKNSEALQISAHYDCILGITGVDINYSFELLEEVRKTNAIAEKQQEFAKMGEKKVKPLQEKIETLNEDPAKSEEREKVQKELDSEVDKINKAYAKFLDEDFKGEFKPVDLSKIPTDNDKIDRVIDKNGVSAFRASLLFLKSKNLLK